MQAVRKTWLRGAVAAGAAGVLAMIGTGAAQAATATQWKLAYRTHGGPSQILYSITAPGKNDAWAVGGTATNRAVILHWNGHAWGPVTIRGIGGFRPTVAESSSPDNVWLLGDGANDPTGLAALVYNGRAWGFRSLPADFLVGDEGVLSASNVWGATSDCTYAGSDGCAVLTHWNGNTWSSATERGDVQSVTKAGSHTWFYALTNIKNPDGYYSGYPVIYEATGNTVRTVRAPNSRLMEDGSIAAAPDGQLWIIASLATKGYPARLFHWTGRSWTSASIPGNVCSPGTQGYCLLFALFSLTYDGHNGVWAGQDAHWTGKQWVNTHDFAAPILHDGLVTNGALAVIPGTASVWGIGGIMRTSADAGTDSLVMIYGKLP